MKKTLFSTVVVVALFFSIFLISDQAAAGGKHDHGLYMGLDDNPPATAVYAGVVSTTIVLRYYVLHISATATGSAGTVTITFRDHDSISFPIPANTSFSATHSFGGVPGVDDIVKITATDSVRRMLVSVDTDSPATKDPFDETLPGAYPPGSKQIDNFVVVAPAEPGSNSAEAIFFNP